jgi:UDP:flavonoid glycosyltransferase YjiC (YdhE family)
MGMASRRVYFAVFGSGLGHATRALDITERLRKDGDEFRYSSSGQGLNYLNLHGQEDNTVRSPLFDLEWTNDGSFSSKDFIPHFPFMCTTFLKQVTFEVDRMTEFDPKLVVSDSRLSAVLAARLKSYPVITMLNQFKVSFPPRFNGKGLGRVYERIEGDVLGLLWSLSEQVLMTDLPPPYTIAEANLEGTDVSRIVHYVGFTSPSLELSDDRLQKARKSLGLDKRPLVYFQISGPDATKRRFTDVVLRSADVISKNCNIVISMGYPGGSSEPKRLANGAWLYDWCPLRDELFALSSLVVSRSGHRSIGQCIDSGKPAVLIPIQNHSEQIGNAKKFSRLGLGIEIRSENLNVQRLTESIDMCLDDPEYRNNAERLRAISMRYNGIDRCVEIINSLT